MALVLFSTVAAGGMWFASTSVYNDNESKIGETDKQPRTEVAASYQHTGTYGDVAAIAQTINQPGFIVDEQMGQDLTGAPCRWLQARNGAVYKTYDMRTQFVK